MYYTTGPLRALERAMQQPPNYIKGGGFMILHTPRRLQELGCVNTAQDSGVCAYQAMVSRFLQELQETGLTKRLRTIRNENGEQEMLYRDAAHKRRFTAMRKQQAASASASLPLMAALFLLSSDDFLWRRARNAIHAGRVDFSAIDFRGISMEDYALYQTARDLYQETRHITLADLTDPEVVNDRLLRLLINAFLVRRHGLAALGVKT